ncbi:hypothetical protein NFI96_003430 [Prochilodus magdalenae]|nr:hypothetical protein NFI96_003430 [Prochilodus magdalenae]
MSPCSPSQSGPVRGCSELYRIPMVEYKLDSEGTPCEYKTPFRRNTTWHRVPTTPAGQPLPRGSPTQCPERGQCQNILQHSQASIPRSTSFDRKLPDSSSALLCRVVTSGDPFPCSVPREHGAQNGVEDPPPSGSSVMRRPALQK